MNLTKTINFNKVKTLLYPEGYKCLLCGKEIANTYVSLCENCINHLPIITGKVCNKCGEPINDDGKYCVHCKHDLPAFTKCSALFVYENEIVKLIHDLKYKNKKFLGKELSKLLVKHYLNNNLNCDVLIPVPLSFNRQSFRGFNQAEFLANEFKNIGLKVDCTSVIRLKDTKTQTSLTKQERKQNMEDAFKILNKSAIKNKNILVVDDVYTTGATINSLAKTLLNSGAKAVYGITVAHTIIDIN